MNKESNSNNIPTNNKQEDNHKEELTLSDIIIGIGLFLSAFAAIYSISSNVESNRTFWSGTIFSILLFIIFPLKSFIKETRGEDEIFLKKRLLLGIHIATGLLAIVALYGIVYLPYNEFKNYYWILSIVFLVILFYVFQSPFSKMIKRIKENNADSKSILNYLGPLILCIFGLIIGLQPFFQFYRADKEVDLDNLKTPYEITVFKIEQNSNGKNKNVITNELGVITNEDFIKKFQSNMENFTIKNIRFSNIIKHFIMKEKSDSYYRLRFSYKNNFGRKLMLWRTYNLSDGYIHEIYLFKDGEAIIENEELDFVFYRSSETEFYKLNLPDSLITDINSMIKKLENK